MGDNAYGFFDMFMDKELRVVPDNCKVVLPTAPQRKVTVNGGALTNAWFDMINLNFKKESVKPLKERYQNFNQDQILESVRYVSDLISAEIKAVGSV